MGLVFAAMIGNVDVAPAFAKNNNKNMGYHDNGRYEHRGRGYDRGRNVHDRRVYRPYGYGHRERGYGYGPPPVIYAPPPPPGIGIFFPPIFLPPIIIHP